jgi:pyridoxamine 5'-phosphate oxidase
MGVLDAIIDEVQVGVLATVDPEGRPAMRWMTPTQVRGRQGYLYALTSPNFRKTQHIANQSRVEWMFQTPDLNRIVTVIGEISMVDNPQLKSEVLEAIGRRLEVFWRVNRQQDFIVLETRIDEIKLFKPMKQERHGAKLGGDS